LNFGGIDDLEGRSQEPEVRSKRSEAGIVALNEPNKLNKLNELFYWLLASDS
jgi:hypothetical protein